MAWVDCIHPDDLESYLRTRTMALQERRSFQAEYRLRRADGEYRWMLSHTTPRFGVNGEFAGSVGTCVDITDVKRAQEEDLARQKLESVGTLAGGIAHDFNNLLGSVLASTELAMAEVDDGASPAESLRRIRDVAIRGAEIVRQLMIYSGQESAVCELVDVSRIVEEMVELLKISTSRQVSLKTAMGTGLPAVMANPAQIRQVVMNLVINASEAIGDVAGTIEVSTSKVKIGQSGLVIGSERLPEGQYVRLSVSDTGRGMSPAEQARVFDPFFTTKTAGHGLGLAVVQGIVRVLGGAIRLSSTPRGTTFEIFLPRAGEAMPENSDPPAAETLPEGHEDRLAVLVIEDEDTLRITVSKLLRKSGLQVLQAWDGPSGLDLLRRQPHDVGVLLLDVTLPGMSSQEVLRQVRQLRPDLKVILTSAYSEESVTGWFAGEKFDGFIRKPYRLTDLTAILR
jgi:signal transduction histidine kinase